jgi:cystathionine beta-lyase family protein involved in aluminum resistance
MDEALVWNRATLGMVSISSSTGYLTGQMEQIERACYRLCVGLGAEITDLFAEVLPD